MGGACDLACSTTTCTCIVQSPEDIIRERLAAKGAKMAAIEAERERERIAALAERERYIADALREFGRAGRLAVARLNEKRWPHGELIPVVVGYTPVRSRFPGRIRGYTQQTKELAARLAWGNNPSSPVYLCSNGALYERTYSNYWPIKDQGPYMGYHELNFDNICHSLTPGFFAAPDSLDEVRCRVSEVLANLHNLSA